MAVQQRSPSDNRLEYTDRNRQIQQQAYPDINTIPTLLSVDAAQKKALDIAESIGWKVQYQERGHIEAIERSFWFGFTDDIVIRISETSSGSMVDIRSASRVGEGDLGVNARRIRQFTQLYLK